MSSSVTFGDFRASVRANCQPASTRQYFTQPQWRVVGLNDGPVLRQLKSSMIVSGKYFCDFVGLPGAEFSQRQTNGVGICSLCPAAQTIQTLADLPYCSSCQVKIGWLGFGVVCCSICAGVKPVTLEDGGVYRLGQCQFHLPDYAAATTSSSSTPTSTAATTPSSSPTGDAALTSAAINANGDAMEVCPPTSTTTETPTSSTPSFYAHVIANATSLALPTATSASLSTSSLPPLNGMTRRMFAH